MRRLTLPPFAHAMPAALSREAGRGAATGGIRLVLQLEGAAVFAAAVGLYAWSGFSWLLFAVLLLVPDLAMLGYLAGPRTGAVAYNLVHTYVPAVALALFGFFAGVPAAA